MMNVSVDCEDQDGSDSPSCYQEFAFCFSFLKKFGSHLSLPEVSLLSLEVFFSKGTRYYNASYSKYKSVVGH